MKSKILKLSISSGGIICLSFALFLCWPNYLMAQEEIDLTEFINENIRCVDSTAEADISWTSILGGNPDYYILRKIEGEVDFIEIDDVNNISYTDNSIDSDKIYVYQIRAEKGSDIYYSNHATTTKKAYCPPIFLPSETSCHPDGPYINLSWSAVSGDLLTYEIYGKGPSETDFSLLATTIETFYEDGPDIIGAGSYYYYVLSKWQDGASAFYSPDQTKEEVILACEPTVIASASCLDSTAPGGPVMNLSWNKLLGVQKYQIYRQALEETDFSLLTEITDEAVISFDDQLAVSLPNAYYNSGAVDYKVQAVWESAFRASSSPAINIPRCQPFLSITNNCESFSFNLKWTAVQGNNVIYNIYRDGVWQYRNDGITNTSYEDGLNLGICPGENCTFNYRIEAIVNVIDILSSDTVEKSINCTAAVPPSPAPELQEPTISCYLGKSRVHLFWSPSDNVSYYTVYRTSGEITSALIVANTEADTDGYVHYLDIGVEALSSYTYRVTANNEGGPADGPYSYTIITLDCVAPAAPTLTLTTGCNSGGPFINLSWTETTNTDSYIIYRGPDEGSLSNLIEVDSSILQLSDSDVSVSTAYYYKVVAQSPGGISESEIKNKTTLSCLPTVPNLTLSKVCALGSPTINLDWTTDESNTFSYEIFRKDFSEITAFALIDNITERHWEDNSVELGITYEYKIEAVGYESTIRSTEGYKSIVASCPPTTPDLSLGNACVSGSPVIDLDWATNEANTVRYEIFRKDSSETIPIYIIDDTSIKDWQDDSVAISTAYDYKVEAVGYDDERSTQGYKSITAYDCSLPGNFTLTDTFYCQGSYPKVDLSWTDSTNADSYDVLRNLLNPDDSVADTTDFYNKTSIYTDWGLGRALDFDGSNDYVNIPYDISINPTSAITVEAWVKSGNTSGYSAAWQIISKYSAFILGTSGTGNKNMCFIIYDTGWRYGSCYNVPDPQNWHHFVGTYDSIANVKKIYVDGTLMPGGTTNPTGAIRADAGPIHIGHREGYSIGSNHFKGVVDEVRIYGRAITATEVQEHYQGIFNNENNLAGLWHFDEGAGNSASDSSNEGNNGTISGATWVENGLQTGERHNWQVDASGVGGQTSALTDPAALPYCPPTKPGLVLRKSCYGADIPIVNLSWSYSYGADSFKIYREGATANPIETFTLADPADPEFTLRDWTDGYEGDGLDNEVVYTYWVEAIGPGGQTESDHLQITSSDCAAPSIPENLQAVFNCNGSYPQINLTWLESTNAAYYTVFRNSSAVGSPTTNSFTDNYNFANPSAGVQVDTYYEYFVRPYSSGDIEGERSNSVEIQAGVGNYCTPSTLSITSLITACESGLPVNTITWSDATDFNTGHYDIYRNGVYLDFVNQGTLIYTDSNSLVSKTLYTYDIKAIGPDPPGLESADFASDSITTYSCGIQPAPPTLNLEAGSPYCVDNIPYADLSWVGVDNAYSYNLYRTNPDTSIATFSTVVSALTDKGDYALRFDGSNDYVNISSHNSLNPERITMEAWIYPTSYSSYGNIINKRNPTRQYILRLYSNTGRVEGYVYVNGGWRTCRTPSNIVAPLNNWSHIVHTYDGATGRVYVNGVEGCIYTYSGNINSSGSDLRIGAYSASSERFKGKIDEVRIYGRVLSFTEIQEHYNNIYKNETELRGAWHFNEGSGNTVYDSSGDGNNGSLINMNEYSWKFALDKSGFVFPLQSNKLYNYQIKAMGVDTESDLSDLVSINTPTCLNPPAFGLYDRCTDYNNPVTVMYWENQKSVTEYQVYKDGVLFESNAPTDYISTSGYIKRWLLIGPFAYSGAAAAFNIDYIDELDVRPRDGETVNSKTWFDYFSNSSYVNFNNIFSPNDNVISYALAYIYSPIEQNVKLWIGSDDGVKAFLNGSQVHSNYVWRGASPDQDKIDIALSAGINTLLIKVQDGGGGWGFYARIVDASGNNILDNITTWDSAGDSADYNIKAKILEEESAFLSSDVTSTQSDCEPAKPDLTVDAGCESGISKLFLNWVEDPNDLTQSYTIHKRRPSDSVWDLDPYFPVILDKTETDYTDSNVTSDVTYQYYVDAVGKGISTSSDAISKKAIICYPAPDKPKITVTAKCLGDYPRMLIEWSDEEGGEVDNAIAFDILRKNITAGDSDYVEIKTGLSSDTTSYEDREGIAANDECYYMVEAVGAGEDNSQFSDEIDFVTALDCANIPPLTPILAIRLTGAYGHTAYASLAWIDSGNEDKYIVLRDGVEVAELVQGTADYDEDDLIINYIDETVSDNTSYTYEIQAVNHIGTTTSNAEIANIPIARPGDFVVSASWVKDTEDILLTWTEAASTTAGGIVSYKVLRDDTTDFTDPIIIVGCGDITTAPFECSDDSPTLLERYYRVEATNFGGTTNSNTVDIITVILPTWKEVKP